MNFAACRRRWRQGMTADCVKKCARATGRAPSWHWWLDPGGSVVGDLPAGRVTESRCARTRPRILPVAESTSSRASAAVGSSLPSLGHVRRLADQQVDQFLQGPGRGRRAARARPSSGQRPSTESHLRAGRLVELVASQSTRSRDRPDRLAGGLGGLALARAAAGTEHGVGDRGRGGDIQAPIPPAPLRPRPIERSVRNPRVRSLQSDSPWRRMSRSSRFMAARRGKS